MVRKIEVTVPNTFRSQIETLLKGNRSVHHLVIIPCVNYIIFQFKVVNKKADEIIEHLTKYGIATSSKRGSIDVHALRTSKPRVTTYRDQTKRKKAYSYYDRLPFDEIEESIDGQLHLTFDYLALIVVGAMIAGVGLLTDSSVSVVASMLVSPLMGPILGMTFGFVIDKQDMYRKGLRNEVIGVLVCFVTGCILGFVSAPFIDPIENKSLGIAGHNTQMSSRGKPSNLIWGALIAVPSGMGVALGVSSDQVSALIGVAISAALLPPITNSGIALCIGIVLYFQNETMEHVNQYLEIGAVSMILFLMNWFLIFIFGIGTFRLKKVEKTHSKLQKLSKYNEMISMPEKGDQQTPGQMAISTSNFGQPLLPSEYGSTAVVIGISDQNNTDGGNGSNASKSNSKSNSRTSTPLMKGSSKHKKSMTDFVMVDNQALQGDSLFDTIDGNTKQSQFSTKSGVNPSSAQLKAIMESNTGVLDRRLSDGVVGQASDWNASMVMNSNNLNNNNNNNNDTRLRHGSLGRH